MFGLGTGELIVIAVLVMVLFGAKKLPELGSGLGKAIRGFQKSMTGDENKPKPSLEVSEPPAAPPAAEKK